MRFSSQRILILVLVVTFGLCMAPGRALGMTNLLAELMGLVLQPFTMAGGQLAQWIRPAPSGIQGPVNDPQYILHIQQERDEFERLYVAEQARVDAIEQQLQQLQMGASDEAQAAVHRLSARVAVRSPAPLGIVTLNRGSSDGVHEGDIAVYNGVNLLGRVHKVSALQCELLPLGNRSTGLVDAAVFPADHRDVRLKSAPRVQLTPAGDGTLRGDVDRNTIVNVGDEVKLFDESWTLPAQGMSIGRVESIEPKESEPLRNTLTVRPFYQVSQVAYITLKIEIDEGASAQPVPASAPAGSRQPANAGSAATRGGGALRGAASRGGGRSGGGRP